jgi:hypothetical protein
MYQRLFRENPLDSDQRLPRLILIMITVEKTETIAKCPGRLAGNPPIKGGRGGDNLLGHILEFT